MYAKIFASLYQGTLRGNSDGILVFTNLMAHADKDGFVDKHFRAIADEVGISEPKVRRAIEMLESPDPESRSPEHDGRRLIRVSEHRAWGWRIVNYEKYRAIRNDEDRREQNRAAQERWRKQNKPGVSNSKPSVSTDKQDKPPSAHTEGEGEAYGEGEVEGGGAPAAPDPTPTKPSKARGTEEDVVQFVTSLGLPKSDGVHIFNHWQSNGWKRGKTRLADWRAAVRNWSDNRWFPSQKRADAGLPPLEAAEPYSNPGEGGSVIGWMLEQRAALDAAEATETHETEIED